MNIYAAFKGLVDEKKAQLFASYLQGAAFDVYMRLSPDEKKNPDTIKDELLREFNQSQLNRESAIHELNNRRLYPTESLATYSYKIQELVKLAYPDFNEASRSTIARDYFIKALSPEMQVALKSISNYSTKSLKDLVTETLRLEIAGISSKPTVVKNEILEVDTNTSLVDVITKRVLDVIHSQNTETSGNINSTALPTSSETLAAPINYVSNNFSSRNRGNASRYQWNQNKRRGKSRGFRNTQSEAQMQMKCRTCQAIGHGYRNCPNRICQACGNRGHDAWDTKSANYSL